MIAALSLVLAACSGGGDDSTTTSGDTAATSTSSPGDGTAAGPGASTTTTGGPGDGTTAPTTSTTLLDLVPDYSIESRTAGQGGDTLVVLLPAGTYSDLDLENVVVDVVERFAPVATVHVVDDSAVVALVLQERTELSTEDRELVDEHYFVRLEEGFRLIYLGPFASAGQVILGS